MAGLRSGNGWTGIIVCAVFCHSCRMAARLRFNLSKSAEAAFSTTGFRN